MTVCNFLIVTGVLGELWVWLAYFKTRISRQLLRKISFVSGSTVVVGLFGLLTELF